MGRHPFYTFTLSYRSDCATYYLYPGMFRWWSCKFLKKDCNSIQETHTQTHTLKCIGNKFLLFFFYQLESSPCVPRRSCIPRGPYLYWPYGFFTSFPYRIISPALAQDDSYFVHTDEYKLIPYLQQRLIYSPFISLNCINVCQFSYLFLFCLIFCSYVFLLFFTFATFLLLLLLCSV